MSELVRPDGARLAWRERGSGPTVVMALQFFGVESVVGDLIAELASDHRVITYDIRGTGASSNTGPFDLDTDANDLLAVIEEAGAPAVVVCFADGVNRSVRAAARNPESVVGVVSPAGNPVARRAAQGTDAMIGSESVVQAITGMAVNDYRGALRSIFTSANPQMSEDELRERVQMTVENCPHEIAIQRFPNWADDDATEFAVATGDRLWLLEHGQNPWFPAVVAERTKAILPEAHIEFVDDGPLSRPDITAGFVRRITAQVASESNAAR